MRSAQLELQDQLLNLEALLLRLKHADLTESFDRFLALWTVSVDRLDRSDLELEAWAEAHWLPMLNQLAKYYSDVCQLEFEQQQAISELRMRIESVLYDRLNQLSLSYGWFEIEVIYPYETQLEYGQSNFEVMGRRTVNASYVGCVVEILCLGCKNCAPLEGPQIEAKARVIVGGR